MHTDIVTTLAPDGARNSMTVLSYRLERHKLSKSQSAAVIECEPVTSTNKLEKPRRVQQQHEVQSDNSNNNSNSMFSNNINSTLPRSMTVSNRSLHNPYQTSSLRRNVSMTNINDNTNGHHHSSSLKNSSTSNLSQSQSSFQVGSCIKYTPLRWISKFVGQA